MRPLRLALIAIPLIGIGMAALPAGAASLCATPPAPGVDWRRCLMDGRDLTGADLEGAVFRDASFDRATLAGARMRRLDAPNARFLSADLSGADLEAAVLLRADFTRANLRGAVLRRADLRRARFFRADLRGADLTGAQLEGVDLLHARLEGARWTDGAKICAEGSVGGCE